MATQQQLFNQIVSYGIQNKKRKEDIMSALLKSGQFDVVSSASALKSLGEMGSFDYQEIGKPETPYKTGAQVPGATASDLGDSKAALGMLDALEKNIDTGAGKKAFTPFLGQARSFNPYDTDVQSIQSQINATKQIVGKYLEGGVLRLEDEKKYEKILPKIGDSQEVARAKSEQVRNLINSKFKSQTETLGQAGFAVGKVIEGQREQIQPGFQEAMDFARQNPNDPNSQKLVRMIREGKIDPITGSKIEAKQPESKPTEQIRKDGNVYSPTVDVLKGAVKGAFSTIEGLEDLGEKTIGKLANKIAESLTGRKIQETNVDLFSKEMRTPTNTAQKVGFAAEQIGEFFIPSSWAAKGVKVAESAVGATKLAQQGTKIAKFAAGAEKLAARAAIEAGTAGAVRYAQTGGDVEEAKTAAKWGSIMPVAGQVLKSTGKGIARLGEKIETSLIKPTQADVAGGFNVKNIFKYKLGGSLAKTAEKTNNAIQVLSNQAKKALAGSKTKLNLNQALDSIEEDFKLNKAKTFGYNSKIKNAIDYFRSEIDNVAKGGIVDIPTANQIKRQVGQFGAWKFGMRDPESDALETVANKLYTKLRLGIEESSPQVKDINKVLSELIPIENAIIRRIPVSERANVVNLSDIASAIPGLVGNSSNWGLFLLNKLSKSGNVANLLSKFAPGEKRGVLKTLLYGGNKDKLNNKEQVVANKITDFLNNPKAGLSVKDISMNNFGNLGRPLVKEKTKKDIIRIYEQSIANEDFMFGKTTKDIEKVIMKDGKLNPQLIQGRINDVTQKLKLLGIDTTKYINYFKNKNFKDYFAFDKANREIFSKMISNIFGKSK